MRSTRSWPTKAENERLKNELANKKTEPVVKVEKEYVTTPVSVFFNLNKSAIASKKDLVNVKNLADYSKDNNAKLVVTGYADSATGPADFNRELSQKRAERVADELVNMGVKRENIQIVAKVELTLSCRLLTTAALPLKSQSNGILTCNV